MLTLFDCFLIEQFLSLIESGDDYLVSKIMYPQMIPLTFPDLILHSDNQTISLRREDLVLSGCNTVLIDNGLLLIIYRYMSKIT